MKDSKSDQAASLHHKQAIALHRLGKLTEAEQHYRAAHLASPGRPGPLHGLGLICLRTQRTGEATAFLEQASNAAPRDPAIGRDLGTAYLLLGRYEEAAQSFEAALRGLPQDADALMGLGEALDVLGRTQEAHKAFATLVARDPGHAGGHFGLGKLHAQLGQRREARRSFERAVALKPTQPAFHRSLAEIEPFVPNDDRLAALEALARDEDEFSEGQKVEFHFALAKAYDDVGRYAEAFGHLRSGNGIRRSLVDYDEESVAAHCRGIAAAFSPQAMQAHAGGGHPSALPVFIVGMPRSGTSLIEQILAAHPLVHGAGELLFINDLIAEGAAGADYPSGIAGLLHGALGDFGRRCEARLQALAPGARRIVDKLPANFRHLGLIHLVLPHAKILHVRRDPMDTCFSCYSKLFLNGLNYTCDLGELGRYHKMYETLMAHWRAVLPPDALLEIRYEDLLENFERGVRRIVDFCGLEWDAQCLRFHEAERPVRTLSQSQVHQPLFKTSVGRWRPYAAWLEPLQDALK